MKRFEVTDRLRELSPEWELADTSHVLLHIDVPNQQLYHLPLLITHIHCVYLVTFDLRKGRKALETIHRAMKHISAYVSYNTECLLDNCSPSKVLLVGTYQGELTHDQRSHFAKELQESLKNRYDDLIVTPGDDKFWPVEGDFIDLQSGPLSEEIRKYTCQPTVPTWQCLKYDEKLRQSFHQKEVKVVVKSKLPDVSNADTEKFLAFLHDYGFIVYCPYEGLHPKETTVVLEPQYLCQQFANAQKISKKKATVVDLFSRYPELRRNVNKRWFEMFCIRMGLVIEQPVGDGKNLVFVLNHEQQSETSSNVSPVYSVDRLLVTFKLQDEDDCSIPPRFFAAFASAFSKLLKQKCEEKLCFKVNNLPLQQLHIVVDWTVGCSIHVVEQESCIEIGFQMLCNSGCPAEEKLRKLQERCRLVDKVVDESAKSAVENLKLPSYEYIQYGFYHSCGKIGTRESDRHETVFQCCCSHETSFTPMQKIWFQDVMDCKVCHCQLYSVFVHLAKKCLYLALTGAPSTS